MLSPWSRRGKTMEASVRRGETSPAVRPSAATEVPVGISGDSQVRTPILTGLGQSLRWLRDRQSKKQYQVADAAGITKGMLSAHEPGRQRPSLETLEKILNPLGCDLNDLHNAIQIINGRPERIRRREDVAA